MKKSDNIDSQEKKHSKKGIISCSLLVIECILFVVGVVQSYKNKGNGGIYLGIIGILIVLFALIGAYLAYMGLKEKGKIKKQTAWFGLLFQLLALIGMSAVFIAGTMNFV